MKKRLLAMLLALMLVVGLLPVGVLADDTGGTREITSYVTPSYNSDEGSPGSGELKTIHVVVRSSDDGSVLQEDNWNSVWSTNNIITVNLTSEASSIYDIESASIDRGTNTEWSYGNKQIQFRWTYSMYNDEIATLTIYLCPEYEAPDFPKGEIDTGATIEYIAYEPALLKLLYVNGVTGVDEHTEINGVEFNFVQNYTGDDFSFTPVVTGANNLMYYTAVLSDVADRGNPRNIRSIDISYTLGDGTEETLRVYSGDLRYIKIDADTYEIEANNDDTSIVAFYNQPGAQYSTWSLYDVKFVNTGDALGDENMPETPTYPATEYDFTNWDKNVGGGSPFLPNEEIDDDTVVYAMKTSSSIGGTEFHVMNTNNVLLDRIVEKYNAENNTEYGISDIVLDSVRIQVNGADNESTNPNYFSNRWESPGNPYYHVNNGGIVGSHEIYSNTHIPHEEVRSITVFATTTDGKNIEVNIPRSNNCGDVSISLVQDNIVEIIINAPPEKPSDDDLYVDPDDPDDTGLLESAVTVTCTNATAGHDPVTYDLLPSSFTVGDVYYTSEGYKCDVTVSAVKYVEEYGDSHTLVGEDTATITLIYSGSKWTVPTGATPVNFNVTCDSGTPDPDPEEPHDPTEDELNQLYVDLKCINADAQHDEKRFHLDQDNSNVTVDLTTGICTVEPWYDFILQRYNKETKAEHDYDDYAERTLTLTWDGETWIVAGDASITRQVKCETPEPEQPNVYKINVTVYNGTATFYGSKVTSHILAAENEDITITFTPDEGYTLDYATIDGNMLLIPDGGVYTLKLVDSNHTIEVFYAEDKLGGGDDGNEPDGTPDYRQVFVKYVAADENGVVTPSFGTFNLEVDENGKVMTNVALSLKGVATPNADATFAYWTINGLGYDGGAYSYEAKLSGKDFTGYVAGETYTFTAYFNGPVVKPEQPNVYDIYVTVHNGTATFYGSKVTSSIRAAEGEDITITFTPDEGYTLDYATIDGNMLLIPDDGVYTLKLVDSDHTIEVFYAVDKLGGGDDGDEPDGIADYKQLFVKYASADSKLGSVSSACETFTLEVDELGKVLTDPVTLSGTAAADENAEFAYWTITGPGYEGGAYSYDSDLKSKAFSGYVAGETYTFKAYFNGPVVKPEEPTYKITVEVVNGTAEFKGTNIGADSVISVYPIKDDNKNVKITFVPTDGYVFDAAYVDDESITLSEDNSYTFAKVTADVTIKVLFKQDSVPITPVTPLPTPGEISDLIKDSITVDCVNGEVAHADKLYGLLDGSLVKVEKTDDTSIKVTLDATVYQARYNTDTETKHSLADGQSATVTFALNYVDQRWSVEEGELPITIKVVCETPVEPDPYNTIHVSFVGPNGEAYGGGDVISTMSEGTVEIDDPVAEGMEFVGWKKLVGLEEIYNDEFTYTALAALVGDNFTPDTHEAWLTFEAVFEDETVEPDPYNIINIRFVDSDGTTSLGGGDVISTSPDAAYPSVPSPVAPQGMKFAGWKVWLGNEPMYEGAFTYKALKALREELDGEITWVDGRTWITFQAVYEDVTVEPDPSVTGFTKTLVTDRYLYNARGIAYPDFYRGTVIVDEGDRVTLIYNITVKGTPGTEFTVRDDSADFAQTGVILPSGETSFYVAKTFSWREIRRAHELTNTAAVLLDGELADSDTETVDVHIDWDYNPPMVDDDDDDDDEVFVPNWLNTTDHYAYIVGYEDGEVKPNNNITRAEVATIFFRLLTDDARAYYWSTDSGFSDVKPGDWYNNAVSTMVNAGILNGYSDGTFKPNANITRAEFATIAARFLSNSYSLNDRFYDTEGHWAEPYINRAAEVGWINGYNDGSFKPDKAITRAEAVTLVNAVLGREPHEDHLLSNMIRWPDNPKSAWYYEAIQEATNSHDYDWIRVSGERVEEWTEKLTERDWAALEQQWSTAYSG